MYVGPGTHVKSVQLHYLVLYVDAVVPMYTYLRKSFNQLCYVTSCVQNGEFKCIFKF
jgi:hypothetical protein